MKTLSVMTTEAISSCNRELNIIYDLKNSEVNISGWSLDEFSSNRYDQLLELTKQHLERNKCLKITYKYELFNPSTAAYLFKQIKILNKAFIGGKKVFIDWNCDTVYADEMLEIGMDFLTFCDFDFNIKFN